MVSWIINVMLFELWKIVQKFISFHYYQNYIDNDRQHLIYNNIYNYTYNI